MTDDTLHSEERRLMKFDPTINTGTILQICVLVVGMVMGYAALKSELETQKVEVAANKLAAERADLAQENALKDLRTDMRELRKTVDDIKEGVAILRGRAADTGAKR